MVSIFSIILTVLLFLPNIAFGLHSYGSPLPSAAAHTLVSNLFLNLSIGSYILAFGLFIVLFFCRKGVFGTIGKYVTYIAVFLHATGYLLRWKELYDHEWGHFPLSNFYEATIFYCLILAFTSIFLQMRSRRAIILAFFLPVIVVVLLVAKYTLYTDIHALYDNDSYNNIELVIFFYRLRVLKSIFLSAGYCLFTTAGISSLVLIVSNIVGRKSLSYSDQFPSKRALFSWNKNATLGGFTLFTFGTILCVYWSKIAWGTYWSWDPGETSIALVMISYAYIIMQNTRKDWYTSKATNKSIVGNCIIIFTYFLVTYLLGGI